MSHYEPQTLVDALAAQTVRQGWLRAGVVAGYAVRHAAGAGR